MDDGDLAGAETLFEEGLRQFGDPSGQSANARSLASIAILRGNYNKALTLLQVSHDLGQKRFWPLDLVKTDLMLGFVAWHQTNYQEAASRCQQSYANYNKQSHQEGIAHVLKLQALLARDQNDFDWAWELSADSLRICRLLNRRESAGSLLAIQGSIEYRRGNSTHAVELMCQSIREIGISKDRILMLTIIEWMGLAFASHGDYDLATHLLAFAEFQRNQMGIVLPPPEQPYHDEAIRILHEALDEETLAQAWQAGGSMTFEEVMAEALEESPS